MRRLATFALATATPAFLFLSTASLSRSQSATPTSASAQSSDPAQPFFQKNCYACHNAKLKTADLDISSLKQISPEHAEAWEKIVERLQNGTMPPKGFPRPKQADVDAVMAHVRSELARIEQNAKPDPGRVTARRLNRSEYNNTIRDLLAVDFRPADDFPQDDSGYGFDNIGDVLSLSPVLMEKYLKAAESVIDVALHGPEKLKPTVIRRQPPDRKFDLIPTALKDYDETGLSMPQALHTTMRFPVTGQYTMRVALEGRRPRASEPVHVGLWIDGKLVHTLEMNGPDDGSSIDLFGSQAEFRTQVTAGDHWVAASPVKLFEGLPASYGGPNPSKLPEPPPRDPMKFVKIPENATPEQIAELKKKAEQRAAAMHPPANRVWIHYVEALGPYDQVTGPNPETLAKIFTCGHTGPNAKHTAACDRKILASFAHRAFRRPVTDAELAPYLKLVADAQKQGSTYEDSVSVGLTALLVSPDFLFRIERDEPGAVPDAPRQLSAHSLASRLSYFIWSSMPDDELLRDADNGSLRKSGVLEAQVHRMLKDPKSKALVDNFAGQWLELRRLESVVPDRVKFPQFDEYLRMSMRGETETFISKLITEDRPILDLIDAKYTYLNEKLAKFYGIPGVQGTDFRKVDISGTNRAGILTQASVLTVSSYATRTSPVLRGKYILENILDSPIPPPPPNVPSLDETKIGASASMRMQMEEHRKNPVCASCHSKMDPLGFAFENFDAIGQYRTMDGKFPVDASGTLPDGRNFNGPVELETLMRGDSMKFAECITDKMLTFALGRGLERYDRRTVKEIASRLAAKDYRFSALVLEIAESLPFQKRRGDRNRT